VEGLQSTLLLCLPCSHVRGVLQGIITACDHSLQVSIADPHHYISTSFLKDTVTQDVEELCSSYLSMCSCPTSRCCSYLRTSRQECISTRLPDINNLQLVTTAFSQNLNLQLWVERFYILLSLPQLLFLSVTIIILSVFYSIFQRCPVLLPIKHTSNSQTVKKTASVRAQSQQQRRANWGCMRPALLLDRT